MAISLDIYVILGKGYTKEKAMKEFEEEKYPHNFFFSDKVLPDSLEYQLDMERVYMEKADEVWCMGDCEDTLGYKMAVKLHKDIWSMG